MSNIETVMPAEWEPHEATWIAWPHARHFNDEYHPHWPGTFFEKDIVRYWVQMAVTIARSEVAQIVAHDNIVAEQIKKDFLRFNVDITTHDNIRICKIPNNWPWIRDSGGICVRHKKHGRIWLNWEFNGWGYGKWDFDLDNDIPLGMSEATSIPCEKVSFVLEGGSIDVNGKGTLITTESCLLNKNRSLNGKCRTKAEVELVLAAKLGITNFIWLQDGIEGDDTSGHIDDLTRFVTPDTVVTMVSDDILDNRALSKNARLLNATRLESGKQLNVVEIQMPAPVFYKSQRVPISYANFYFTNDSVLMPIFGDRNDNKAIYAMESLLPDRKITPIVATDLAWGLGSFHCLTQQQPK